MNGYFVSSTDGMLYWDNSKANSATLMLPVSLVAGTSRKKGWRNLGTFVYTRPIVPREIRDRRLGSVYNDAFLVAGSGKCTEILVLASWDHGTSLETIKVSSAVILLNRDSYEVAAHASRPSSKHSLSFTYLYVT
jgi:hypothetical protein